MSRKFRSARPLLRSGLAAALASVAAASWLYWEASRGAGDATLPQSAGTEAPAGAATGPAGAATTLPTPEAPERGGDSPALAASPPAAQQPSAEEAAAAEPQPPAVRPLVMIDPGHQRKGNNAQEPVGPGSRETKAKVSSGTAGVQTGKPEYVLNLEVSLRLREELTRRGFEVSMTRESHDVDISNKERAELSNQAGAALTVRIHADGDASPRTRGFSVLYPSTVNEELRPVAEQSREAAGIILEQLRTATGTAGRGLSVRSDLSGFNWSVVPVVLVELGFMTNPEEDVLLSDPEYQNKLAAGIAEGIEQYLLSKGGQGDK